MREMTEFGGLHAVVTGGSRGIGAAIAAALTHGGARVTILGRSQAALKARIAAGEAHSYIVTDVTNKFGLERAIGDIESKGAVDILVNNAGAAVSAPFARTSNEDFARMLDTNFMAPAIATRSVLAGMIERKFGRIVNICSTAALKGYPYISAYAASKHALLGLTRSLALELIKTGVTVNAVCPGFVDTDMVSDAARNIAAKTGRDIEVARAELIKMNPQGRLISPSEVADAVCFLARRTSGSITGTALTISGGEV